MRFRCFLKSQFLNLRPLCPHFPDVRYQMSEKTQHSLIKKGTGLLSIEPSIALIPEFRSPMSEIKKNQESLIKNGVGLLSMEPCIAPTSLHSPVKRL